MQTQLNNLNTRVYPTWHAYKILEAYRIQDDVFSVVKYLSETAAKLPMYGYDAAGEDLPDTAQIAKFVKSLRYKERIQLFTFMFLFDECFIYKNKIGQGIFYIGKLPSITVI